MNEPVQTPPSPAPTPATPINDPRRKSPFLAFALSAMPGLGQVYVGYYQRGFTNAVVVATLITLLASDSLGPLIPLVSLFLSFFWLYNLVDAGRRATLYNEALAGRTDIELPRDFEILGFGGSLVGGVCVALLGFVLLLHTRFDVSLDWIEDWWPLALIAFGFYLVYKARRDTAAPGSATADEGPDPDLREV